MDAMTTISTLNNTWILSSPGQANAEPEVATWSATYRRRNMVIGLIGALLNVLTLVAIVKHKDLTKFLRYALASLISTDLGLLATIFVASLLYLSPDSVTLAIVKLVYIFCDCTALTLLVIALDRACALYLPIQYKSVSEHYVKIMLSVLAPWMLAVCFSAASFKDDIRGLPRYPIILMKDSGILMQAVLLLTCGIGVLLAYVAIGVRLTLRARRFVVHPSFFNSSATDHLSPSEYQRCRRLTVHTIFLALWFCIIYITFSCYLLVMYNSRADPVAEFNSPRNIFFSTVIMVNSIVNPFLFFWRLVDLKPALDFIRRMIQRGQQHLPQQTQETQQQEMVFTIRQMERERAECRNQPATYPGVDGKRGNSHGRDHWTVSEGHRLHGRLELRACSSQT